MRMVAMSGAAPHSPLLRERNGSFLLTREQEAEAFHLWEQTGDVKHRNKIVMGALPVISRTALHFRSYMPHDLDAMENHCVMVCLEKFHKFDPARGVRYATFAHPWIYTACYSYIYHSRNTVRPQLSAVKQKGDRQIGKVVAGTQGVMLTENNGGFAHSFESEFERQQALEVMREELELALAVIHPSQAAVIRERWLADEEKLVGIKVLAERRGVSRQRVNQLELRGLDRLREAISPLGRAAMEAAA